MEHTFLNGQKNDGFAGNRFLEVQQPCPVGSVESTSSAWLNQFTSMKLEDPLEFDSEYKRLYAGYQSQQQQQQQHQTRQNVAHVSPALHRSVYQHRPVTRSPVVSVVDAHFEKEFEALERELQDNAEELEQAAGEEVPVDYEQFQFQKIAGDIVDSCSSKSNSPSPVSAKLSGSKFMSLMRDISGGFVTLSKDSSMRANELRAQDGRVIGNEFMPVMDHVHNMN